MKALRKRISTGLTDARKIRELSQTDLAKLVGLQPSAISHFETGRRHPSCGNLLKLCDALEVSIDDLFGRTEHKSTWVSGPFGSRIAKCFEKMKGRDQQTIADLATMIVEQYQKPKAKAGVTGD